MKKIIRLITAGMLLIASTAVLEAQNSNSGRLDLRERIFDFGLVPRDAKVTHTFILKNIGSDTLKILNIKPTCSCTTAPVDKNDLASHDSTTMLVTFSSGKRSGSTEKIVEVTTNMEPRGLFPITISAYVESPTMKPPRLTAEPRSIIYTPPDTKTSGTVEVTLTNNSGSEMQMKIIDYPHDLGIPRLGQDKIQPGKSAKLIFEFVPQSNLKVLNHSITLEGYMDEREVIRYTVPIIRNLPADYSTSSTN